MMKRDEEVAISITRSCADEEVCEKETTIEIHITYYLSTKLSDDQSTT